MNPQNKEEKEQNKEKSQIDVFMDSQDVSHVVDGQQFLHSADSGFDFINKQERITMINHKEAIEQNKIDSEEYAQHFCFKVSLQATLHPQLFMKSNYQIDLETRQRLLKKEQWYFTCLQQGWFIITVMMTALFELLIFTIGFLGSDEYPHIEEENRTKWQNLMVSFRFLCVDEGSSRWFIDHTKMSMTLFKLHFIVIFMYTLIFDIVLFKIPYRYDRIKKTRAEKLAQRKRQKKKRNKKRKHKSTNVLCESMEKDIMNTLMDKSHKNKKRQTVTFGDVDLFKSNKNMFGSNQDQRLMASNRTQSDLLSNAPDKSNLLSSHDSQFTRRQSGLTLRGTVAFEKSASQVSPKRQGSVRSNSNNNNNFASQLTFTKIPSVIVEDPEEENLVTVNNEYSNNLSAHQINTLTSTQSIQTQSINELSSSDQKMTDTNAVELEERTQNISVMSLTSSGRDSATILKIELEKTSPLATDDQDVL